VPNYHFHEVLQIPLGGDAWLCLREEIPTRKNPAFAIGLPEGWKSVISDRKIEALKPNDRPLFLYDPTSPERGMHALRLFELRDYYWEIKNESQGILLPLTITSSLEKSTEKNEWKPQTDHHHGRFRYVNYLGSSWIEVRVEGFTPVRIAFEVASPKLDYETEYRAMVESIGEECQQLLLEWGTPATVKLSADPNKQHQGLLEQFLFLRHVLGQDKLALYLEIISRRPHSKLERETTWKPAASADPRHFISNPMRYGRDWRQVNGSLLPDEIQEERKFDSLNTPPNRFIKFSLKCFHQLCENVLNAKVGDKPAFEPDDAIVVEATGMLRSLDSMLALPLFNDVEELERIPFDSTTLQNREGYREILLAWLMLDAASNIDWPGREDAYDGTTRNVATLYEYWIYFVLVRAFKNKLGMEVDKDPLEKIDNALPFCCHADDGRLRINLSQGKASFSRFQWKNNTNQKLRIHLFYNREFKQKSAVGTRGSYSKIFRPDYTLVVIPEEFDSPNWELAERNAELAGRIAYLHFDAKYRGENLEGIFGTEIKSEDAGEEQRVRAVGAVKNVDLYKMHTYNEAIRRTVGSYVIYPGGAPDPSDANQRFERYHEIIPSVGAFALRPVRAANPSENQSPKGLEFIVDFIQDILTHHLTRFSQSYRVDHWRESTVLEAQRDEYKIIPDFHWWKKLPPKDTKVMLGFVRGDEDAEICRLKNIFFCHAVEWLLPKTNPPVPGKSTPLDFDPFRSHLFVPYFKNKLVGWTAQVDNVTLVTAEERAIEMGKPVSEMNAAYYFRFQLNNCKVTPSRDVGKLVTPWHGKPIQCRLSELALCQKC